MINDARREQFILLAEKFVSKKLAVNAFDRQFTKLWMQYRDQETDKKMAAWPERYDLQIIAALQHGEISKDEFARKFRSLWGYSAEEWEFQGMIDAMHSALSVFTLSPQLEWEINEELLRQEAEKFLTQCRRALPMQTA